VIVGSLLLALSTAPEVLAQEPIGEPVQETVNSTAREILETRQTEHALRRKVLRSVGGAGVGLAAVWWMVLGDGWDSGDPASLVGGLGLVAASGAILGGGVVGAYPDESPLAFEAGTPTLSLTGGLGGTSIQGEQDPYTLGLEVAPRVRLGDGGALLVLAGELSTDLGWALDLDPRPQGDFDTALQQRHRGLDLAPELRLDLRPELELRLRSEAAVRFDRYVYGDGDSHRVRRSTVAPLMAGICWKVSPRQRFWFLLGPRWDHLAWRSDGQQEWDGAPMWLGPLQGEAAYEIHAPHPHWLPTRWTIHRRFRLSYDHTNFDGKGFNSGAAIGFFGPLEIRFDARAWRPGARWALQGAVVGTIADHGGVGVVVGVVPPGRER